MALNCSNLPAVFVISTTPLPIPITGATNVAPVTIEREPKLCILSLISLNLSTRARYLSFLAFTAFNLSSFDRCFSISLVVPCICLRNSFCLAPILLASKPLRLNSALADLSFVTNPVCSFFNFATFFFACSSFLTKFVVGFFIPFKAFSMRLCSA